MKLGIVWCGAAIALVGCKTKAEEPSAEPLPEPTPIVSPPPDEPLSGRRDVNAEQGPHADYPTPVGAGTDKIFLLEDPDRGPLVDLAFKLPRDLGASTTFAWCEVDELGVVCGPATKTGARWTVWRKGAQVVAQERRRGGAVKRTFAWVPGARGKLAKRVELDDLGRVVAEVRFAADASRLSARKRTGANALDGCGAMAYALDGGRLAELRCLQWSGEPMHDTNGVGITRYVRNASGFVIEVAHFGVDGKPIGGNSGVHRQKYARDASGRDTGRTYLTVDGAPAVATNGCFGWSSTYDKSGDLVRTSCLGSDGQSLVDAAGVATTIATFDDHGCERSLRSLGVDGRPVANEAGVHGRDFENDRACRTLVEQCVDLAGTSVACGLGQPARRTYAFDDAGRVISTTHHDADGNPGGDSSYGVFELRSRWDDRDRETWAGCFDASKQPVECSNTGFHARLMTYDDVGREIEMRFTDTTGAPTTNLGTAVNKSRYDNYDHLYEEASYGESGQVLEVFGMATRRHLYDANHLLFGTLLLDAQGKPARYTACFAGSECPDVPWHAVRIVRRSDGVATSNMFFDDAGQRLATHVCTNKRCFE